MISSLLSFAILIFWLVTITFVIAGIFALLMNRKKNTFLLIFKAGMIAGSAGLLLTFLIAGLIDENKTGSFAWMITPGFWCIGIVTGVVRSYRKIKHG